MDIKVKWFYRLGFLLLLFVVLWVFFKLEPYWKPVLEIFFTASLPFIVAAFIAYLLHPLIQKLHKNGLEKWLSLLIIYILFFGGLGYLLYKGVPVFVQQLKGLSASIPEYVEQYDRWAYAIEERTKAWPLGIHEQIDNLFNALNTGLEHVVERILESLLWIVDKFFLILLIPFITFYMIKDMEEIKNFFWQWVPLKKREEARLVAVSISESLGNYLRGQFIVCCLIGAASAFLFSIIKLKFPLLLGFIVGITNVIPYFGPFIGAVPAVLVGLTMSGKMALFVVVIIFSLQFLEGNILSPLIVGKTLRMHPLAIIFSILIGGEVAGVLGLILAVPSAAVLKTIFLQSKILFEKREQEESKL